MSLFDRFTPPFVFDLLVTKEGKMTQNWINWINELTSQLNLTFVSGRDTAGGSATNQKSIPFMEFPKMTTSQRDSVVGVVNGTVIYNTTSNKFQGFAGGAWVDFH